MFDRPTEPDRVAQLSALLASPVPRAVPPALARVAQSEAGPMALVVFGIVFAAFGLLLGVVFFPWRLPVDLRLKLPDARVAPGRIAAVEPTNLTINKRRVMEYRFEFGGAEGPGSAGLCYTTGRPWEPGAAVEVRYAPDHPSWACPVGARASKSGAFGLIVLVFPIVGIAIATGTVVARRRALWLLREGEPAEFRVTAMEATLVRVKQGTQYRITLERVDHPGLPPVVVRRNQPAPVGFARARLESGQPFYVLLDPRRPERMLWVEIS